MFNWYKTTENNLKVRLSLLALLFSLTACQVNKKPDLARLYQPIGTDFSNTPLILIHGSLGSKLRLKSTEKEVWPGKIKDLIFSNYKILANQIIPDTLQVDHSLIESYAIFDSFSGLSIYDDIIQTLTEYGNYHIADLKQMAVDGRSLYIFHYDWRQDNVYNAQRLAQFIDQVLNHAKHKQVDVVAHSLGGLILRYYQRFGAHDILPLLMQPSDNTIEQPTTHSQASKIRHAVFLGTPQLGTVKAIDRLRSGFDFNLRNIPVEVQITMPSVYQLLPHPFSRWAANSAGELLDIDIYNPELWQKNQWAIYDKNVIDRIMTSAKSPENGQQEVKTLQHFFNHQLLRAQAFWHALTPKYEVDHEGFIIMGGSCNETLNRVIAEKDTTSGFINLHHSVRREQDDIDLQKSILFEPGDGQVSKSSLLGQAKSKGHKHTLKTIKVKYPVFVCEDHLKLTENITFQDNLLHVLLNN